MDAHHHSAAGHVGLNVTDLARSIATSARPGYSARCDSLGDAGFAVASTHQNDEVNDLCARTFFIAQ